MTLSPSRPSAPAIAVGDTVRMGTNWLRSTFTYSGPVPQARGTVVGLSGSVVRVRWDRPCFGDSLESSVLAANLQRRTAQGWEPRTLP